MVSNADGTNRAAIYSGVKYCPAGLRNPSWSPDGKAIAFRKNCNGVGGNEPSLWRIDVSVVNGVPQGSNARRLVTACGACGDPGWSPTGEVIVIGGGGVTGYGTGGAPSIFLVDSTTGAVQTLYTAALGNSIWYSAWSSDGTRLAISEGEASTGRSVIRIVDRANGNVVKTLTPGPLFSPGIWFIDWARQGVDKLAFVDPSSTRSVYTVDIATETYTRIVDGNAPTWSPDNSKLAFNIVRSPGLVTIVTIELATGIITKVGGGTFPDWRRF